MITRTLQEDLTAAAAAEPDKVAVKTEAGSMTYGEFDRAADRLAAGLYARGVERGDRVVLFLPNVLDMCTAVFGVARSGAAFVPVNATMKEAKLAEVFRLARPAVVLCDDERAEMARAAAASVEDPPSVATVAEASADGPVPEGPLDIDLGAVMFTSGSTGEPKGVMLSHRNFAFATTSICEYLEMTPEDRILSVLPLSFGYGLSQLLTCVRARATLVLELGLTLPGRVVRLLEDEKATGFPAVPTAFAMLTALKGLAERELPHLRFVTNAGAGLSGPGLQAVRRTFPRARLYSMYGQTECTRVCFLQPDLLDVRPASVGRAIPGTDAWVVGADGEPAEPGEVGELMVRGDHVMQGYWDDPEGTGRRLRAGRWPWERVLATGDLFRTDEEGYLYFVGRSDDIIKSRGEKVAPREVEDVLYGLPGVAEAAVVGVPDRLLGEAVIAHVVVADGTEGDPEALRRGCAERLEDYMVPRRVVLREALPRTPNGKLDRRALAAEG